MSTTPLDVRAHVPSGDAALPFTRRALNSMSAGLGGSRILAIAAEIKVMQAAGRDICNLTVGDFKPEYFSIPETLRRDIVQALADGETNYPPAIGLPATREAVRDLYERDLGLNYPVESVIMGSGARPPIFATYALVVQPGDTVLYGIPSWNNHYYCHMNGATVRGIPCGPETNFLLSGPALEGELDGVTLLCLNSPLNPCGTAFDAEQLGGLCDVILAENRRRETKGQRPVMVMYDQVYWMLCFGETQHLTPPGLRPEMAAYTIFIDAISKSFAATGLRVGWGVVPEPLSGAYKAIIGHMGAWAPRPEQVAVEKLLKDPAAIASYHSVMKADVETRLRALHDGFAAMGAKGLPVSSIAPQGAIYLSARFDVLGRRAGDTVLATDEDIRAWLLEQAGFAVVNFQAFGVEGEGGWMRLSVGAVSMEDIEGGLRRIEAAFERLG